MGSLLEPRTRYKEIKEQTEWQVTRYAHGGSPEHVVGEFLRCVIEYVKIRHSSSGNAKFLMITPGYWTDSEIHLFRKAIEVAVSLKDVSLVRDVEVGALWLGRKLLTESKHTGIIIIGDNSNADSSEREEVTVATSLEFN